MVAVRQHLGRKSLQRRVGKTNRRHRAAQMRRAARGNYQTEQGEIQFSARRRLRERLICLFFRNFDEACKGSGNCSAFSDKITVAVSFNIVTIPTP